MSSAPPPFSNVPRPRDSFGGRRYYGGTNTDRAPRDYSDGIYRSRQLRLTLAARFDGHRLGGRDRVHSFRDDTQCRAAPPKRARPSARAGYGNVAQVCQGGNSPVSVDGLLQLHCRGGPETPWRRSLPRSDGDQDPAGVRRLLPGGSARGPLSRIRPLAREAKSVADGADPR